MSYLSTALDIDGIDHIGTVATDHKGGRASGAVLLYLGQGYVQLYSHDPYKLRALADKLNEAATKLITLRDEDEVAA